MREKGGKNDEREITKQQMFYSESHAYPQLRHAGIAYTPLLQALLHAFNVAPDPTPTSQVRLH